MRVSQIQVDYLALQFAAVYQDAAVYAARVTGMGLSADERNLLTLEHRTRTVARALEKLQTSWEIDIAGDEPR